LLVDSDPMADLPVRRQAQKLPEENLNIRT